MGESEKDDAEDPGAAVPPADLVLRFSEAAIVGMDDERILIGNRDTGGYRFWARAEEECLGRYMSWRSLRDILAEAVARVAAGDEIAAAVNAELDRLVGLMTLGVLEDRAADLSGARLDPPGPAWEPALRFLLATRTTADTIFAIPEEYNQMLAERARLERQPSAYYERPGVPVLQLSEPGANDSRKGRSKSFKDVLLSRRTTRRFSDAPMTEAQLSTLLYYGWGETKTVPNPLGDVFLRKTSPSGGSLHPVEVYPVVLNVEGVPRGLYHYSVRRHALEELSREDPRDWVAHATGDQQWVAEAGVVFLITAFLPRTAWKYNYPRVARAVISEVGFSSQSAFLTATWQGLGAFHTIALRDQIWEEKLGLDPIREPVFGLTGAGTLEEDIDDHSRPRQEVALGVDVS
ncbi:SagB family peptide dehydrogenase [uncultured Roseovarius sp.]|uniref:SagB family peptide dehydrogenase n=1 Tax=uncultured Roseovarius sp. TaxID=293344 RepID=UPI0026275300|nr:SagB family peptide dehydrogenase [uncultured Roseovarius sp.]